MWGEEQREDGGQSAALMAFLPLGSQEGKEAGTEPLSWSTMRGTEKETEWR